MDRRALAAGCAAGFAFAANYTNHAPMVTTLRAEFGFDNASAGVLTTGVFLTHAAMQIPGGWLADRLGPARVMLASLAWVAVANFAIAFAGAYWQLLLWKTLTGLGTGACFAAGARYIISTLRGRDLHLAQGFYGGSIVMGSGFVLFAVPQLLGAFGWRGGFVGCALVATLVWIWWLAGVRGPLQMPHASANFLHMAASRELWTLGLIQMASFGLVIVVGTWITTLLKATYHLPLQRAGFFGSLVLLLGIVSRPLGGWLAHRLPMKRIVCGALLANAVACTALGSGVSLSAALAAILVLGIGCGVPYAGIFNRAAAGFPGQSGVAMGFVNAVGIVMILVGAPAVGALTDWTGQFNVSFWTLGGFSFLAAAASLTLPYPMAPELKV